MSSIIEGYTYDIFISYRQNDNKYDGWVSEFVDNLNKELEANIKDKISVYFDINPQDGLLETDSVDKSLEDKLKCLIFIPIISQTYCDSRSFAWLHEFCAFNKLAKEDKFGRDIRLSSGNVASRILPIKIHDLDPEDKTLLENEIAGFLRSIEFIYKSSGVNRPLRANEEHTQDNLNKTYYRDQINKVAHAVKEIIAALKKHSQEHEGINIADNEPVPPKKLRTKLIVGIIILLALSVAGYFFIPKIIRTNAPLEKSIAVLPFNNLSNDPEQEYFSDGMVDAILDHLFKVGELKVISRTSTMRYKKTQLSLKEIAHELGVSAILEGSVQKIGNNVRITAQLIDTRTDTHLWSGAYDKALTDVFSVYSEVAQNIARELKVTLTPDEARLIQSAQLTSSQVAYDYFLKGNDYLSKSENSLASDMYTKAGKEDPLFADAYARRARSYLYIWWNKSGNWQGTDLKAKEDIRKVLELNPELTELKIAQAYYYYFVNREYDKALKVIDELKDESPNMADLYTLASYVLRRQGRWLESIKEAKLGIRLDPYNAQSITDLASTYQLLRQYDNQIEYARQGLSLIPDYKNFNRHIFNAYLHKNMDVKVALKESGLGEEDFQYEINFYTRQYEKLIEFIKKDTVQYSTQFIYEPKTFRIVLIQYLKGNKNLCKIYADSAIKELKEKIMEFPDDDRYYATLGKCYAFIGNYMEAINNGKKAVELKPMKLDAYQGVIKEQDLMEIYIFTGNFDLAMDKMEDLLSIPSNLHKGDLSINPIYGCLRDLPRFQKILKTDYKIKYN
jgi:TolB-like protein